MKETLHNGVVIAVSASTHAGKDAIQLQSVTVDLTCILAAPIGMKHQCRRELSFGYCHIKCLYDNLAM